MIGISPALVQYGCFVMETDFASQQIPFILETKRMLSQGVPFWSWNHFLGDNFIGCYSFYTLTSPFVWLNCLFPESIMLYSITLILILKMVCAGCSAYLYLKKMLRNSQLVLIGALMYTFSSFTISNLYYYHFLEPMIVFPVYLLCLEKYLRNERYSASLLVIASFLVAFINFYFLPCTIFAAAIYVWCRTRLSDDIQTNSRRVLIAILLHVLGFALSAFILLPTFLYLTSGDRANMHILQSFSVFNILAGLERLQTIFIPQLTEGINPAIMATGWNSNAANVPIVGGLLAALYVIYGHKKWLRLLIAISVVIYITPLNAIFSLFTDPTYSRWAYALTLFLILASLQYIEEMQPINGKHLLCYFTAAIAVCILCYGITAINNHIHHNTIASHNIAINAIIAAVFFVEIAFLYIYRHYKTTKVLLCLVIVFSLIVMPLSIFMKTDAFTLDEKHWKGAIDKYITDNHLQTAKRGFNYRTDFITRSSGIYLNAGLIKNYPSTAVYSSCHHPLAIEFEKELSTTRKPIKNAISASRSRTAFNALTSVKQTIIYDDSLRSMAFDSNNITNVRQKQGYKIADNKLYIPMGFTYSHFISQSTFDSVRLENPKIDAITLMLDKMVVPEQFVPLAKEYMVQQFAPLNTEVSLDSIVKQRRATTCDAVNGNNRGLEATITMTRENLVFFSFWADKGFKAFIDGKRTEIIPVNMNLSAVIVPAGHHKIKFTYTPSGYVAGCLVSMYAFIILLIVLLIEYRNNKHRIAFHNSKYSTNDRQEK